MRRWHIVALVFCVSFAVTVLILLATPRARDVLAGRSRRQEGPRVIRVRLAPRPGKPIAPAPPKRAQAPADAPVLPPLAQLTLAT